MHGPVNVKSVLVSERLRVCSPTALSAILDWSCFSRNFTRSLQANVAIVPGVGHDRLLPDCFSFISHLTNQRYAFWVTVRGRLRKTKDNMAAAAKFPAQSKKWTDVWVLCEICGCHSGTAEGSSLLGRDSLSLSKQLPAFRNVGNCLPLDRASHGRRLAAYFAYDRIPSGRAVWGVGLRPLACWDCGFGSHRGGMDVCLFWVLCVIYKPQEWGDPGQLGAVAPNKKKVCLYIYIWQIHSV